MKLRIFCRRGLSGAAICAFFGVWSVAASTPAHADSICTTEDTLEGGVFTCADLDVLAEGTFTGGASAYLDAGGLRLESADPLTVHFLAGEIVVDQNFVSAVRLHAPGDLLFYVSQGVTRTSGIGRNTDLLGASVVAQTGTVISSGSSGSAGVFSVASDGDNFTTGGTTIVTGDVAVGIQTQATNGDNITNSGTIVATGLYNAGVSAATIEGSSCGNLTVNVTGDIHSHANGVRAQGCGSSTVNVGVGTSMTRIGTGSSTIQNIAATNATNNIDGAVYALTPGHFALDTGGVETHSIISSTGMLSGTYSGWTGNDRLDLEDGAVWLTTNTSWFGDGTDSADNSGIIRAYGTAEFQGLEQLFNLGAVDLTLGPVGNTLSLPGDYIGSGGVLLIDADELAADRLIVSGSATGTTFIYVNASGVISAPVMVVDVGDSTDGAFQLATSAATQLIDLHLTQAGADYFVTALPNASAYLPMVIAELTGDMWHQSAGIYSGYSASRRAGLAVHRKDDIGIWGQLYYARKRSGEVRTQTIFDAQTEVDDRIRTYHRGAQGGIDFLVRDQLVVGLTGGFQHADADHRALSGGVDARGHNIGVYGQFDTSSGIYAGALFKRDWTSTRLTHAAFNSADASPNSINTGLQAEAGYRWQSSSVNFDLGAGLSYVRSKIDGFAAEGITYDYDSLTSLRGQLGARLTFGGPWAPFVEPKLYHEFGTRSELLLASASTADSVRVADQSTWGRLEGGFGSQGSGVSISGWVEMGDIRGFGIEAGVRL